MFDVNIVSAPKGLVLRISSFMRLFGTNVLAHACALRSEVEILFLLVIGLGSTH